MTGSLFPALRRAGDEVVRTAELDMLLTAGLAIQSIAVLLKFGPQKLEFDDPVPSQNIQLVGLHRGFNSHAVFVSALRKLARKLVGVSSTWASNGGRNSKAFGCLEKFQSLKSFHLLRFASATSNSFLET